MPFDGKGAWLKADSLSKPCPSLLQCLCCRSVREKLRRDSEPQCCQTSAAFWLLRPSECLGSSPRSWLFHRSPERRGSVSYVDGFITIKALFYIATYCTSIMQNCKSWPAIFWFLVVRGRLEIAMEFSFGLESQITYINALSTSPIVLNTIQGVFYVYASFVIP